MKLAAVVVASVVLGACAGEGPVPLGGDVAWGGSQFVVHSFDRDGVDHWVSSDGVEWSHKEGATLAGWQSGHCYPGFDCDVSPEQIERVPLHTSKVRTFVQAAREDTLLVEAQVSYDIAEDEASTNAHGLNREVVAVLANQHECFAAAANGADDAYIDGYSLGYGEIPLLSATCLRNGVQITRQIDLGTLLDERQLDLARHSPAQRQLFAVSRDGEAVPIKDQPLNSAWADGQAGGRLFETSQFSATDTAFWSLDAGRLVASDTGVAWSVVDVDTAGLEIAQLTSSWTGDIALLLVDDHQLPHQSEKHVLVSHDDGITWTEPISVGAASRGVNLSSVGPAGVALYQDHGKRDMQVYIPTQPGPTQFTRVTMEDDTVGRSHLIVGDDGFLRPRVDGNGQVQLEVYDATARKLATSSG